MLINIENISISRDRKTVLSNVNFHADEGEFIYLTGKVGTGKSTFLKVLSGEIEPTTGEILISKGERISFLRQDHYQYEEDSVLDVVIMGNEKLYQIMTEKNKMYMQTEFSEEDGMKLANLEAEFMELDGWNAESDAATLLNSLGVDVLFHSMKMKEIPVKLRVKVLLAQALFGNPDILLLDEPTNSFN